MPAFISRIKQNSPYLVVVRLLEDLKNLILNFGKRYENDSIIYYVFTKFSFEMRENEQRGMNTDEHLRQKLLYKRENFYEFLNDVIQEPRTQSTLFLFYFFRRA